MSEPLKPCPFCGGGAVVSADMSEFPQVACDACGASQGKADGPGIAAAIAAWNRRAALAEVQARDEGAKG